MADFHRSIRWRRVIFALLICLPILLIGLKPGQVFVHANGVFYRKRLALYFASMLLCMGVSAIRPGFISRRQWGRLFYIMLVIAAGGLAFQYLTCSDGTSPLLQLKYIPLNLSLCLVIYTAVWFFIWDARKAAMWYYWLMCLCGFAYECIYRFRGVAFKPMDILSFGTALSVAGSYNYTLSFVHVAWFLLGVLLWAFGGWISDQKYRPSLRRPIKALMVCMSAGWIALLVSTNLLTAWNVVTTAFEQETPLYNRQHGTLGTLIKECHQLRQLKPDSYDPDALGAIEKLTQPSVATDDDMRPNVIVVVNESFADLQSLWQIETNQDPMPYLHALQEQALHGNLAVSSYGGSTCNTEHSFFTSTPPTPLLNMPLLSTVRSDTPALPWAMKSFGYRTIALHPHVGTNYQRNHIYPRLGFDQFFTLPDFQGMETVRGLTSDLACYEKVISLFEQKAPEDRLFMYCLTLQNHSAYTNIDIEKPVALENGVSHYELTNYLNLLAISDNALQQLVEYFEQQNEPVILLFFGDHQPNLDLSMYSLQNGLSPVQQELSQYITPFVIWANYPVSTGKLDTISVNYLTSVLFETAGLPLTSYDQWLLETMEQYPVTVLSGYSSANGTFARWQDAEWPAELQLMNHLRYNRLYDPEHRLPALDFIAN